MDQIIKGKKTNLFTSKFTIKLALCITSFLMAYSSNALLFNPFILSTIWASLLLSPSNKYTFLISLVGFGFLIGLNYGLELLIVSAFMLLIDRLTYYFSFSFYYKKLLPLLLSVILLSIRYLSIEFSYVNVINALVSSALSFIVALSLNKSIDKINNKQEKVNDIFRIVTYSWMFSLFLNINVFNVFLISLLSLIMIKIDKREVVFSSLFLLFIYNYLFFYISLDFLLIYLLAISLSMINKKYSPLIFLIISSSLFAVKYSFFYKDLSFYLNFICVLIVFILPKSFFAFLVDNYVSNDDIYKYQAKLANVNLDIQKMNDYLHLLKKDPIQEKNIKSELLDNVNLSLCSKCQNESSCSLKNDFDKYLVSSMSKEEKNLVLNNCYYPYKLIKRFQMANKSYLYQLNQQENKKVNKELFSRQVDTLLTPIDNFGKKSTNEKENKFTLDYEALTSSFSKDNGDSYLFINKNNKTLLLLSDGMGHSKISSQISSYLIELFTASYSLNDDENKIIQDINLILKTKTADEIFATLDLALFDLEKGVLKLYKAGSFSSFLLRDEKMIMFNKVFPPLGIIDKLDIFKEEVILQDNDYFIFLTDGFSDEVKEIINKSIDYHNQYHLDVYTKKLYDDLDVFNVEDDKTLIVVKVNLVKS